MEGIVADTRTLTEILDELLTAADTRSKGEWTTVDIDTVVDEVAGSAAAAAEKSGVTLTVADPASGAKVEGSPASLRRALIALVDNAVGHARSTVAIAVRAHGRRVEIEVSDDGPGIPADLAPRLFERFSGLRSETGPPEEPRHYGLGLALVADVAANHDGRVDVANHPDGRAGAVFTLSLPAHRRRRNSLLTGLRGSERPAR